MTDAIQQGSRYQCALKNLKNASLAWGIPSITVLKLRRLKFPVISIGDCSLKQKTRIKIPVSSISIIPQYCRSAPNNTRLNGRKLENGCLYIRVVTALSSTLN